MNLNKKLLSVLTCAVLLAGCIVYSGCSNDSPTSTPSSAPPTITMKPGSTFIFTYDSLTTTQTIRLRRASYDIILAQTTVAGQLCYPIFSTTHDSVTLATAHDTTYVRYDNSAGKFYQYGIQKLINPMFQNATWDLVADFSVPQGQSWLVGNINYSVVLGGQTYTFTGPLNAKVAEQTTIQTTGSPSKSVNCYRIELHAAVTGNTTPPGPLPVTADIYVDYYIGYASSATNPSGLVEVKLRPFSFLVGGLPLVAEPGDDRKLWDFTIAP
jgi:hypothetical protein